MSRSSWALAALMAVLLLLSVPALAAQGLYTVQKGDSLWAIAQKHKTTVGALKAVNGLATNLIYPGQVLNLPVAKQEAVAPAAGEGRVHIVRRGDTLWQIARRYGTTVADIKEYNRLANNLIYPGQPLRLPPPTQKLADEDLYWLVRVISAEAKGEPLIGQIAVGAVVLNRVKSPLFPNTIKEVIFQPGQFSVVADGSIYEPPVPSAYTAARLALRGYDPTNGSLYFYNPHVVSRSNWIRSRTVVKAIGRHLFAS